MSVQTIIDQIHIVEYDHSYAASLADMWNRSNESWGGGTRQRTEEAVRQEMENSSNLHEYLAIHNEEVVGFCSFAHYRFDENALYVPLLNVRPDYHGYKIGRNLILKAVEKTVEAGGRAWICSLGEAIRRQCRCTRNADSFGRKRRQRTPDELYPDCIADGSACSLF